MRKPQTARRRRKKLLVDVLNETVPERAKRLLDRGLPADADPFQRFCFELLRGYARPEEDDPN